MLTKADRPFKKLALARLFLVVLFIYFFFHILNRDIDMRKRNVISEFIQDSKQRSLPPYHLICMVVEIVLKANRS